MRIFSQGPGTAALLLCAGAICCTPAPAGAAPRTHLVVIDAMAFSPATLVVNSGDTVLWINRDMVAHDATSGAAGLASPAIAPGARWKFAAGRKGSFGYTCTLHPMMKARLIVK